MVVCSSLIIPPSGSLTIRSAAIFNAKATGTSRAAATRWVAIKQANVPIFSAAGARPASPCPRATIAIGKSSTAGILDLVRRGEGPERVELGRSAADQPMTVYRKSSPASVPDRIARPRFPLPGGCRITALERAPNGRRGADGPIIFANCAALDGTRRERREDHHVLVKGGRHSRSLGAADQKRCCRDNSISQDAH